MHISLDTVGSEGNPAFTMGVPDAFDNPRPLADNLESAAEADRVRALTQRERNWHDRAGSRRFQTADEVEEAFAKGLLVEVTGQGEFFLPVARFRSQHPAYRTEFQPYLVPEAAAVLSIVGDRWAQAIPSVPSADWAHPRFSVTSMSRPEERQDKLDGQRKLALSIGESSHATCWTFDLDMSGHYWVLPNGKDVQVSTGRTFESIYKAYQSFRNQDEFSRRLAVEPIDPAEYGLSCESGYIDTLKQILGMLHDAGMINYVLEYEGDAARECAHVAVNPALNHADISQVSALSQ